MKTKELIEETERHIKNYTIFNKAIEKEDGFPTDFQIKRLDYYESILSALSATIPRETAAQKPTEEDGRRDGCGYCCVTAYHKGVDDWESVEVSEVLRCPYAYTYWLPMPEIPEVEK